MTAALALADFVPPALPSGWHQEPVRLPGDLPALRFVVRPRSLRERKLVVLLTLDAADDGCGIWLHSSTSREGRLASWEDLKLVHEVVHGDRPVVQLMPPRSSWLSIADCLHLFERLDADTVPEKLWRLPR